MIAGYLNYSQLKSGQLFDENRSNKGILRPALKELEGRVVIEQIGEPRALDWHGLEQGNRPFRWSGPNPKPKILIPYAYPGEVEITLCIPFALTPLHKISIWMNGHPVHYDIPRSEGVPTMVLRTNLNESDYSILTLHTEMTCPNEHFGDGDFRWVGLAISDIIIEPLDHQSNLRSTRGPR